ncbi:MAG: 50S ribosomal protein L25 [Armatimonadota bacterium]
MAEMATLHVQPRAVVGSGKVGRLRRQGEIPGVLYGHGEPTPILVDAAEFRSTISPAQFGSLIVRLNLEGRDAGTVLVKAVQVDTLKHSVLSIDLQRVSMDDFVSVSVPIVLEGEPIGGRVGGILEQSIHSAGLRCRASSVPEQITVDVSRFDIGDSIRAGELPLLGECELQDSADEVVAVLLPPTLGTAGGILETEAPEEREQTSESEQSAA